MGFFGTLLVVFVFALPTVKANSDSVKNLRLMTANLSSGANQSYTSGEGIRIMQALKPDVIMVQEFNYKDNSSEAIKEMVNQVMDGGQYYRENEAGDKIPNGVISRLPILSSGEWEDSVMPDRDFAWAKLETGTKKKLWIISVHLSASKPEKRAFEAKELIRLINDNIPEEDYLALGGDFNTKSSDDPALATLGLIFKQRAAPADTRGNTTTNMARRYVYDWLLANDDLEPHTTPVRICGGQVRCATGLTALFELPGGLVFDSSEFPDLGVVAPVNLADSHAQGMQHLPVIKDFQLP